MLFDKVFSAYGTPVDAREPWPCADQHEPGDGTFTRWAATVQSLLIYHHSTLVTSASSHTELRGRKIRYSCLVVWGPQVLRSVMGELAMAHGQTIKGRTIDVDRRLEHLDVLDLQAADLFWHEANETGVGYFAHLDASLPVEECALVLDHARYLSKHPRLNFQEDPPERRPGFRIGPADSMVLPSTFGPEAPLQKKHDLPEQLDGAEKSRGGGLPRQPDPRRRRAVELHAEDVAIAYYQAQGWRVVERGRPGRPYDLLCVRGDETKHVEVKGLSGPPVNVRLTVNERRHARAFANIDLFVVHGIRVSNVYEASGGAFSVYENWTPQEEDLTPTEYQYRLPPA
ncbi:protein NO VEIN domain-containing protein [Nocardiopsis sp. JB363]|uniref:protein NO VEIN domain-containing protein n=1 Tax=Nocardiopsis sp. JB363 TaxID=1434837 RepID=UPI00117DC013|nr:DUF3883 domain-containing protein [Nocardiopsis sp. JB363]